MTRVSPPELARELPGPHASTRVTRARRRSTWSAVQPPNAPAPTTTTCRCLLIGIQPFRKGDAPSAVLVAAQDSRNHRRGTRLTVEGGGGGAPPGSRGAPRPPPPGATTGPPERRPPRPGARPRAPAPP